jgi:hypothetical protein
MNDEQKALIEAMINLQSELTAVKKDCSGQTGNRKFSYANLESIWEALQPLLVKNNLWFTQAVTSEDGKDYLESTLYHKSGGFISNRVEMKYSGNEIKEFGGAISYYRRYAMQAIFSVVCSDDIDPEKSNPIYKNKTAPAPKQATAKQEAPKPASTDKLSSVQINKLHQMTDKHPGLLLGTVKSGGYAKVEDVPANQYKPLVELLQKQMNQKN